jgi:hypothetical protein
MTPRRVESSLLVVEDFKDETGAEWRVGDRAPLARRAVRQAATERPELFRVEFETLPFDPAAGWFGEIVTDYERRYAQLKARRDGEEERRQAALRRELKEQDRGQPDLERRYKRQEKEKEQRIKQARDEHERRRIEMEIEFASGYQGFGH